MYIKLRNSFLKHINKSSIHLKENNVTYIQHLQISLSNSVILMKGVCQGVVHAFFPSVYTTFTKDTSIVLEKRMQELNQSK